MKVNEETASEKWCPFSRAAQIGQISMKRENVIGQQQAAPLPLVGYNRYFEKKIENGEMSVSMELGGNHCLGSGCMMWRGDHCGLAGDG